MPGFIPSLTTTTNIFRQRNTPAILPGLAIPNKGSGTGLNVLRQALIMLSRLETDDSETTVSVGQQHGNSRSAPQELAGQRSAESSPVASFVEDGVCDTFNDVEEIPHHNGSSSAGLGGKHRREHDIDTEKVAVLVAGAQNGDTESFGQIYDIYNDTVLRYIFFRVNSVQLAEDLTSETFMRAMRRISSFTWQGKDFGAWLVTIARNLVADYYKSGRFRLEIAKSEVIGSDQVDSDDSASPEIAALDKLTNATLLTAVNQLNPEQQECIVLRFLQGFTVAETARAMRKNEGAVKALQYRAVRTLARILPEGFQRL